MKKEQPEAKRSESQEIELMEVNNNEDKLSIVQHKRRKFNKISKTQSKSLEQLYYVPETKSDEESNKLSRTKTQSLNEEQNKFAKELSS